MGAISTMFNYANVTMGLYQSRQEAQVRKAEAELAANSLEAEAARKDLEAAETLKIGELDMAEQQVRGRADIAELRTSYAASGVRVYEGSALDATADKAAWNEYERQRIEYDSNLQSWGLSYDAALLRQEAGNTRASGVYTASSSRTQSLLGSAGKYTGLFNRE